MLNHLSSQFLYGKFRPLNKDGEEGASWRFQEENSRGAQIYFFPVLPTLIISANKIHTGVSNKRSDPMITPQNYKK